MSLAVSREVLGAFTTAVFSLSGALWSLTFTLLDSCESPGQCNFQLTRLEMRSGPCVLVGLLFLACLLLSVAVLVVPREFSRCRFVVMGLAWVIVFFLAIEFTQFGFTNDFMALHSMAASGTFLGAWLLVGRGSSPVPAFLPQKVRMILAMKLRSKPESDARDTVLGRLLVLVLIVAGCSVGFLLNFEPPKSEVPRALSQSTTVFIHQPDWTNACVPVDEEHCEVWRVACDPGPVSFCGDGVCTPESGENCQSCDSDCSCGQHLRCSTGQEPRCLRPKQRWCGDGQCSLNRGENCATCWEDCRCKVGEDCRCKVGEKCEARRSDPARAGCESPLL